MKRVVLWVMSTLTVLVLLFGYHTSTSSRAVAGGETAVSAPAPSKAATNDSSSTGNGSSGTSITVPTTSAAKTASSAAPDTTTPPSDSSASGTTTESADPTPSASAAASSSAAATVTGEVAQTRWGPVQVAITVQGGTMTDVQVVQYPNGNGRDQEINAQALPILVSETLSAQNANIDMVSGATVTSDGYLTSLQSALDQAGL
jgi:uncharacterized protein with FMN-binding domain